MSPAFNKKISIIVAIASNNAIGKNNELLWKLSDDLKRFKKITTGHKVVMGRNTFLSLPNGPLPNRKNVVITDREDEEFEGCEMAYSIEEALANVKENEEAFIIGGGMIYKQFLPHASKLYLTRINREFDADTFFPEINYDEWIELERSNHPADEKNEYDHTFIIYKRK
ncbi:MAG: dihydrofolate reductase [Bacteroidales bacterium]